MRNSIGYDVDDV